MKNLIWKRPDGTIAITTPLVEGATLDASALISNAKAARALADAGGDTRGLASDQYLLHEHVATDVPVPPKCEFRNAMVWDGKKVAHDMARARDIRREQLRREREPMLAALDVDYQRADEIGDAKAKAAVAAKKQALRDITKHPGIDAAKTLDDLRAVKLP